MATLMQIVEELLDRRKLLSTMKPLMEQLRTVEYGDPIPYVGEYLNHPNEHIRTRAMEIIIRIDFDRSLEYTLPLLNDEEWQYSLCDRFCRFQSEKTIDALIYLLQTAPNPSTRYLAAAGLRDFGDARAIPVLEHAIAYDDGEDFQGSSIREVAIEAVDAITRRERDREK